MADQKKLAIVVGAGASKEYSFPIGSELKQHIVDLLDIRFEHRTRQQSGDYLIMEAFRLICRPDNADPNDFLYASWRIRDSLPQAPSIDQFIHTQRGDRRIEVCGKLAIARAILQAESQSSLYIRRDGSRASIDFEGTQNEWLDALFRVVIDGCIAEELGDRFSAISLIVFNYDRSIEHYLFHALRNYYKISEARAAELIGQIRIFHSYGAVGELPWQNPFDHVAYGADPSAEQLISLKDRIKTFTEGTDPDASDLARIRAALGFAPRVLFLGFAYHQLNLNLLVPQMTPPEGGSRRVIGTALGLSAADCAEIRAELGAMFQCPPDQVQLRNDLTAAGAFAEYTRALSFRGLER
ncbi:MAG TPA: hypothetical protein VEY92_10875 [Pseudoxanthomonas sp.]|nr:hypothetical protein [Pseudoxanthomonas sp.]